VRKLTIVFFDAGGGHRSAAEALKSLLEAQPRPWEVQLLNLQELLDSIDVIQHATGIRLQDGYNLVLRKGWTRPAPQLLVLLRGLIRLKHKRVVKLLARHWRQQPADVVLSVIPLFNRALASSLRGTTPATAFVTLLTDLADFPPHFWIERESEYLICGTERAREQALAAGHSAERVFQTSGMILKPRFYQKTQVDRAAERQKVGLDAEAPTGIVLFGGYGAPAMLDIAKALDQNRIAVQLIMICGHNQKLLAALKSLRSNNRILAEGFTSQVDYYMSLADFFIGKPGPGSISEALQFHLPVIVERNARTMPQERYNTEWVREKRLGIVLHSFRDIASGVRQLLEPETFNQLRSNASAYSNQALFEIPGILEEVFLRCSSQRVTANSSLGSPLPDHGPAWASFT
jgi:Glycosyltransferase family 28 C-terminal domain/Monogalactosyldiacylglycerol (MGDG) synthase